MDEYTGENQKNIVDTKSSLKIKLCVKISGMVQGVCYRNWTVQEANAAGIEGWVANRLDGSVGALFVGREAAVQDMIEVCRKGPLLAKVTSVTEINYDKNTMPKPRAGVFYNAGSY